MVIVSVTMKTDNYITYMHTCINTYIAVSFWTAAVNWRLAGETRYTMMREVFSKHKKLKELLEWMIRRVDRKDEVRAFMHTCVWYMCYTYIGESYMRR